MLKSALIASMTLAGAVQATVQGFDVSNWQPAGTVDFAAAYSSGARFVIIKVSDQWSLSHVSGTRCLTFSRPLRARHTLTPASRRTTPRPRARASSVAATTSLTLARPPVPPRPTTSLPTGAAGPTMESRCPACWTSSPKTRASAGACQLAPWSPGLSPSATGTSRARVSTP